MVNLDRKFPPIRGKLMRYVSSSIDMEFFGLFVFSLFVASATNYVSCHHRHHSLRSDEKRKGDLSADLEKRYATKEENEVITEDEKNKRILNGGNLKGTVPFSERRLEKMLEKAILKIITGDLSTGDMLLLKSLNYSLEEVLAIRERELNKKRDEESKRKDGVKSWTKAIYGDGEKRNGYWDKSSMVRYTSTQPDFEQKKWEDKRIHRTEKSVRKDYDFEAYNRQAILDYENLPPNAEFPNSWSETTALDYEETTKVSEELGNNLHRDFDKAMEPHVVFKIRYDDSEFDSSSGSDESNRYPSVPIKRRFSSTMRHTTLRNTANSFHATASTLPANDLLTLPLIYRQPKSDRNDKSTKDDSSIVSTLSPSNVNNSTESTILEKFPGIEKSTNSSNDTIIEEEEIKASEDRRIGEYEGLEWVEDDVYRVLPEFVDSLGFDNPEENRTSDYDDSRINWDTEENENDTSEYQNDTGDSMKFLATNSNASVNSLQPLVNLSTYLQAAIAHRRGGNLTASFDSQGEKAIEEIKSRVLALTGRFNLSSSTNQIQRERLTMFSPTCQIPRNTDQDVWTDPYSMNMHFQLNLTSGDHVIAAKLRIFKLPQENVTSPLDGTFDEEEEDEKKIRISVYYYTKSLRRHRSKKRLMDSVVTPLTSKGTHLALDVRQGLRFWRLNPRNVHSNGSNHGLVVQVEDQDGKPLKPALYIQQPSCEDQDPNHKAFQRVPALFVRACTRYVRIINGKTETYINCRH